MTDDPIFAPTPVIVRVAGEDIAVAAVRMGRLPGFISRVEGIAPGLMRGNLLVMARDRYDEMRAFVAFAVERPEPWVDGLTPAEFLNLLSSVIEVNGDFFVRRIMPAMMQATGRLAGLIAQVGAMSPPTSPNAEPPSEISGI